jgi:hypothetical protein
MKPIVVALIAVFALNPLRAVEASKTDDGYPFGIVDDSDMARLVAFAKTHSENLEKDCELAYNNDESALSRVFAFSLQLGRLDDNARTYGQIIWSSFLNLSEGKGTDWYFGQVKRQPRNVQQRIRDFLHYATVKDGATSKKAMSESDRKEWTKLFPEGYVFGADDPIFPKQANQSKDSAP